VNRPARKPRDLFAGSFRIKTTKINLGAYVRETSNEQQVTSNKFYPFRFAFFALIANPPKPSSSIVAGSGVTVTLSK
jgi:hypothetical protein